MGGKTMIVVGLLLAATIGFQLGDAIHGGSVPDAVENVRMLYTGAPTPFRPPVLTADKSLRLPIDQKCPESARFRPLLGYPQGG